MPALVPFESTLWNRFRRWLRFRSSRSLEGHEVDFALEGERLWVNFYCPRVPLRVEIRLAPHEQIGFTAVQAEVDGSLVPVSATTRRTTPGNEVRIDVDLLGAPETKKLAVDLNPVPNNFRVDIRSSGELAPDRIAWDLAVEAADLGDYPLAIRRFTDYEAEFVATNPHVPFILARIHREMGNLPKARYMALRSMMEGLGDSGWGLYQEMQGEEAAMDVDAVRELQREASSWEVAGHHGLVVLDRHRRFEFGPSGYHLKTFRELMEVRRAAGGRFMKTLAFPVSATSETVLSTRLRILHADGSVDVVPTENFNLGDSENRNVFITVEDEKAGIWILPDLQVGDVIDWTYCVACRNHGQLQDPEFFILSSLFQEAHPTYRAETVFATPPGVEARFVLRNGNGEPERTEAEDGWVTTTFRGERYVPMKNTGFHFENHYLNPLIGCSHAGDTWSAVARRSRLVNFGDGDGDETLPEPLKSMVEGVTDPDEALERAFYWTRDKLKYAALRSGSEAIGRADRARQIVESGTGDCKDKSYLLSLVARTLGLPFEYVAVSTKNGLILEELPGQQFDHVFIRVRIGDQWRYLDAANQFCPYGSAPSWCQGLQGMVVDGDGVIITVPEDEPERNRIRIRETFTALPDDWLHGEFDFQAWGHLGRMANEQFKMTSLVFQDARRAAQEGIGNYLPHVLIHDHERLSDTGSSPLFQVTGRHARAQLFPLGDEAVGRMHWNAFLLPWTWRNLHLEGMYVQEFPLRIEIDIRLEGEVFGKLLEFSRARQLDNQLCSIHEVVEREAEALTVRRTIVFRGRFVSGELMEQLPPTFEALEHASMLVLSFRNGE